MSGNCMKDRRYESCNISKHDMEISNELLNCRIFWTRVVSSENESLLTKYTRHTFYEIQYALEGHIGMIIGKDEYVRIDESDFVIIPPDTCHQVVDDQYSGARFIMAFSVSPKDGRMKEKFSSLDRLEIRKETPHMRSLLSLILEKREEEGILGECMIKSLMEAFLVEILNAIERDSSKKLSAPADGERIGYQVAKIQEYIRSCHGIDLQVSDIAKKFGISERHLNRMFHTVTGRSTREAINYEKLKKIEEYIVSTELSLGEIAGFCGFCDEYAMNKFFKRYNYTTLSDFRRISRSK